MKLFAKEKGIILLILNAILVIWTIAATVVAVSNITTLVIKDYEHAYKEYELAYCDLDYDTKEECLDDYNAYKLDKKIYNVDYKRNLINACANIILVGGVLVVLNREKKNK